MEEEDRRAKADARGTAPAKPDQANLVAGQKIKKHEQKCRQIILCEELQV